MAEEKEEGVEEKGNRKKEREQERVKQEQGQGGVVCSSIV